MSLLEEITAIHALLPEGHGELTVVVATAAAEGTKGPAQVVFQRSQRLASAAGKGLRADVPIGGLVAGTRVRIYVLYRAGALPAEAISRQVARLRAGRGSLPARLAVQAVQHVFTLDVEP
jgi:hypothetical protein